MATRKNGFWALLAAAVLALPGCSTLPGNIPGDSPDSSEPPVISSGPSAPTSFTLAYDPEDTLNPYAAVSRTNLELSHLLYDSLTALDAKWVAQPSLAVSVEQTETLRLTAVLREDAVFSDGSPVTAADVVYSFNQGKASANYKALLANLIAAAPDENKVVFTLAAPDPHAAACLTFPVLKSGTADNPVGGGRYMPAEGPVRLVHNPHAGAVSLEPLYLREQTTAETIRQGLEAGTIQYFFDDLSDGDIPRLSCASVSIPMNNLVFLGVNAVKQRDLENALVRQALAAALDRTALAETAFAGRAQAALTPFHPAWGPAVELKGFSAGENLAVAVAQLEQAGYNTRSNDGVSGGKELSLTLLYVGGNSFREELAALIKQQLEKTGLALTLEKVEADAYRSRLQRGDFELYLGEIRLSANMSLRPLLTEGGAAAYGVRTDGAGAAAYSRYLAGELTLEGFCEAFTGDAPFIPLCWRKGVAAYDRNLSGVAPIAFNPYYGIESWVLPSS